GYDCRSTPIGCISSTTRRKRRSDVNRNNDASTATCRRLTLHTDRQEKGPHAGGPKLSEERQKKVNTARKAGLFRYRRAAAEVLLVQRATGIARVGGGLRRAGRPELHGVVSEGRRGCQHRGEEQGSQGQVVHCLGPP